MEIVVKGRHTEVPERFRRHAVDKLARVERLDSRLLHLDVELCHERNPRQADHRERVEITGRTKGSVVRSEAAASDHYAALDLALDKLESRLRKAHDRRLVHRGNNTPGDLAHLPVDPESVRGISDKSRSQAPAPGDAGVEAATGADPRTGGREQRPSPPGGAGATVGGAGEDAEDGASDDEVLDGGLVVRRKVHRSAPLSIDQALHEMELVGHDFYLFCDAESGLPSVVYCRRGYDYGVIRLQTE